MARIEFKISLDGGRTIVESLISRLDPHDEVVITGQAGSALQWIGASPFAHPAADGIFALPQTSDALPPLRATAPIDMTQPVAQCGSRDQSGGFEAWSQDAGFPNSGGSKSTPPSGG